MNALIVTQIGGEFASELILCLCVAVGLFFISLYVFRSIFNIPSFLRYQKAQIRLLEEIAKKNGVDGAKVEHIVSESIGWEPAKQL